MRFDTNNPARSTFERSCCTYSDIHDLGDFPQVDKEADEDADLNHKVGLVVQDIEQHHQRLENSKYDGAH